MDIDGVDDDDDDDDVSMKFNYKNKTKWCPIERKEWNKNIYKPLLNLIEIVKFFYFCNIFITNKQKKR